MATSDIKEILAQRGGEYGSFANNALVTETLVQILRQWPGWTQMEPIQREALRMICHKMARLVCGNPNSVDGFADIAGYAQLVVNFLQKDENE